MPKGDKKAIRETKRPQGNKKLLGRQKGHYRDKKATGRQKGHQGDNKAIKKTKRPLLLLADFLRILMTVRLFLHAFYCVT